MLPLYSSKRNQSCDEFGVAAINSAITSGSWPCPAAALGQGIGRLEVVIRAMHFGQMSARGIVDWVVFQYNISNRSK